MKIIDCSYLISNSSPVYPGDPKVDIQQIADFKDDGFELTQVTLTMHTATHLDAPCHLSDSSKQASDFPVDLMISDACILDISSMQNILFTPIQIDTIHEHKVVFLYTGWSQFYGEEEYFNHPILTLKTAETIIQAGVQVVVIDTPSVDNYPYEIHKHLFNQGVWIVENTRMYEELLALKKFKAIILPINIKAEAALTRVLVMEKDD